MHHGHDNHEGGVAHEIEWAGWYEQFGSKTDVSFQNMQLGNDGKIHGGGKDPNGEFAIHGHLSGNEVKFDKAYKGAHTVNYSGKLDHGVISGKWSLTGMEGTFEIKMKTKQWKGHFTHGGSNFDMLVSLQLNEFKTVDTRLTGLGSDAHGNYSLHGFRPRNHPETVHFKKQYFGQNSAVHYAGVIGNINGHETIKGVWMLPSGDNGTFAHTQTIFGTRSQYQNLRVGQAALNNSSALTTMKKCICFMFQTLPTTTRRATQPATQTHT